MGGRFGKYGDAKRKGLIRKNRLREKNMFKTYARSARTSHLSNGHEVWLETKKMADYERADLVSFLCSVMRWDKEYDREEVIWALANYLGFRRLTDGIRAPIKSAINSAIRQGNIVGSRSTICRIL